VIHLHEIFFGKSVEQVQEYFGEGHSIERMDELLFAPRAVFQYNVGAFAAFVMSDRAAGDADSASPFLSLLKAREQRDPGSVKAIYESLAPYIQFIAENQTYFNADLAIYGDFNVRACEIERLCVVADNRLEYARYACRTDKRPSCFQAAQPTRQAPSG